MDNPAFDSLESGRTDVPPEATEHIQHGPSPSRSRLSRLWAFLKQVAVEPIVFLHLTALLMTQLCLEDLVLDRACRVNFNFTAEICSAIMARNAGNYTEEESTVQKLIAEIGMWKSALECFIPSVIVLILGSWNDRAAQRLQLILPQIGTVVRIAGLIFCSRIDSVGAEMIAWVSAIPSAATGGFPLFSMAYNNYISVTSSNSSRTLRLGNANFFVGLGVSAGLSIAGNLLSQTTVGYLGVLMIGVAVEILVIGYTYIFISNGKDTEKGLTGDPAQARVSPTIRIVRVILAPLKFLYKMKENRLKLILILASYIFAASPFNGEPNVLYLFTRKQLNWDIGAYANFSMAKGLAQTAGVFFAMGVLTSWLQMSDPLLGALSSISQLSSCFIYAFARTNAVMYTAAGVDVLNGAMAVASRSMASKLVGAGEDEQGMLHSLFGISDAFNPFISSLIFTGLYRDTLDSFPGAFFLLSAADTIPPLVIFVFFMFKKF